MDNALPKIAQDLVRYTSKNPEAADTPEGIAMWWLGGEYPLPEVRRVLAELVNQGVLAELWGTDLQMIYRKNRVGGR